VLLWAILSRLEKVHLSIGRQARKRFELRVVDVKPVRRHLLVRETPAGFAAPSEVADIKPSPSNGVA
jgi:hypothetical protein